MKLYLLDKESYNLLDNCKLYQLEKESFNLLDNCKLYLKISKYSYRYKTTVKLFKSLTLVQVFPTSLVRLATLLCIVLFW